MHDYFVLPEVARVALVVGVIVSIVFYERVQLTTGGAIVPAYLALFLAAPLYIGVTLVSGYLTYLIVSVVIAKRVDPLRPPQVRGRDARRTRARGRRLLCGECS
ncbi:MAG: poly-gamma-glutamate biosynthesis protein PgsC/CapC [Thermoleophilaceae bacterium]